MLPRCCHCSGARAGVWLGLVCGLAMACLAPAPPGPFTPYQHRALYLYHFATFTTWPSKSFSSKDAPLVVGVLGKSPFVDQALDIIKGEPVGGHKVEVRLLDSGDTPVGCHVLFICQSEAKRAPEIVKSLDGAGILTVAEMPGFLDVGGVINLIVDKENKLQFEVNLVAARKAGLRMSSQLLRLAKHVKTKSE